MAKSQPWKVKDLFPCYFVVMPSAFEERSLDLSFTETPMHVFGLAPPSQNKEYITWLDMVQNCRKKQWEDLRIFNVIQISRTSPRYNPSMLLVSIFFWEGSTNKF